MAEPSLNRECVLALIGQPVTAGMPKHVRMHSEADLGDSTGALDQTLEGFPRHRPAALGDEDIYSVTCFPIELAQRAKGGTIERVNRWHTSFDSVDLQAGLIQIDVAALEPDDLAGAEAVPAVSPEPLSKDIWR
jgi:hypothetical protein